jgi:hypothetical protein
MKIVSTPRIISSHTRSMAPCKLRVRLIKRKIKDNKRIQRGKEKRALTHLDESDMNGLNYQFRKSICDNTHRASACRGPGQGTKSNSTRTLMMNMDQQKRK